jgi:hypothetical protein
MLRRTLDNAGDAVSSAFPKGKQHGRFFAFADVTPSEPIKRAHSPQLAAGLASVYKLVLFLTVKIPRSKLRGASIRQNCPKSPQRVTIIAFYDLLPCCLCNIRDKTGKNTHIVVANLWCHCNVRGLRIANGGQ